MPHLLVKQLIVAVVDSAIRVIPGLLKRLARRKTRTKRGKG